jgi:hypothetical protein
MADVELGLHNFNPKQQNRNRTKFITNLAAAFDFIAELVEDGVQRMPDSIPYIRDTGRPLLSTFAPLPTTLAPILHHRHTVVRSSKLCRPAAEDEMTHRNLPVLLC